MPPGLWLYGAEDIGGAAAFIFVIPPRFPSGCRRRRGSHIGVQGDRLLIQADYRFLLVIRPFVYLQDVFHLGDVFFIEVGHRRGRDAGLPAPPAQIPTSGTTA